MKIHELIDNIKAEETAFYERILNLDVSTAAFCLLGLVAVLSIFYYARQQSTSN
jgi:hypothetical protein